jgi:hypothetical protein
VDSSYRCWLLAPPEYGLAQHRHRLRCSHTCQRRRLPHASLDIGGPLEHDRAGECLKGWAEAWLTREVLLGICLLEKRRNLPAGLDRRRRNLRGCLPWGWHPGRGAADRWPSDDLGGRRLVSGLDDLRVGEVYTETERGLCLSPNVGSFGHTASIRPCRHRGLRFSHSSEITAQA